MTVYDRVSDCVLLEKRHQLSAHRDSTGDLLRRDFNTKIKNTSVKPVIGEMVTFFSIWWP